MGDYSDFLFPLVLASPILIGLAIVLIRAEIAEIETDEDTVNTSNTITQKPSAVRHNNTAGVVGSNSSSTKKNEYLPKSAWTCPICNTVHPTRDIHCSCGYQEQKNIDPPSNSPPRQSPTAGHLVETQKQISSQTFVPTANDAQYHVIRQGKIIGQFTEEQVRSMLSANMLGTDDLAWKTGMATWQPLGVVISLATHPPVPGKDKPSVPVSTIYLQQERVSLSIPAAPRPSANSIPVRPLPEIDIEIPSMESPAPRMSSGPSQAASGPSVFLNKLLRGDYGLWKTFWLFGFLPRWVMNSIIAIAGSALDDKIAIIFLVGLVYEVIVSIGTWRAADKYEGSWVWSMLAKTAIVIGMIRTIVSFLPS